MCNTWFGQNILLLLKIIVEKEDNFTIISEKFGSVILLSC